jgi:PLP dependent protein
MSEIADNLLDVNRRIAAAAARAGRDPREVLLLAVSKTFSAQTARQAFDAGQAHFGENRVQEARDKAPLLPPGAVWHLIGPLQGNKAKYCPGLFAWIHSLDSAPLARELGKRFRAAGKSVKVLVQVNLGGEEQKSGCRPEEAGEILAAALAEEALAPCGLMCIPPWAEDPEEARPHFRALRELRDRLLAQGFPREALRELSMGMSHDFAVAIGEGATIVRVGSALFGKRG